MKRIFFAGLIFFMAGLIGTVSPAKAQIMCGERANIVKYLEKGYGEEPVSMGLTDGGSVVEVFASKGGSFTIIVTRTDGVSCLLTAGSSWESHPVQEAGSRI